MSFQRGITLALIGASLLLVSCGDSGSNDEVSASSTTATTATPPVRHHEVATADLTAWQTDLNAVGCWAGPVDGELGPRTEAATREFQEAKGLTVDGLLGGQTSTALEAATSAGEQVCQATSEGTAARTVSDATIHELEVWQHDLNVVGCWAGPEDGTLGPQTEAAIRAFQTSAGLAVDGRLGPQTEQSLAQSASSGGTVCTDVTSPNGADDGGGALDGSTTTTLPFSDVDEGAL